jgi:hypothetical protein
MHGKMALAAALILLAPPICAQTAPKAKIIPFPGTKIYRTVDKDLDRTTFDVPGLKGIWRAKTVEGARRWTIYQGPRGTSGFAVFEHYRARATAAGFRVVASCANKSCPSGLLNGLGPNADVFGPMAVAGDGSVEDTHYLIARRVRDDTVDELRIAVRGPVLPVALVDMVSRERPMP